MKIHLVDGTYELFRAYFALPAIAAPDGREVGAVRGLVQTLLTLLRQPDVSHVAVAFDSVIHSFRNDLFDGYKTGRRHATGVAGAVPPGGTGGGGPGPGGMAHDRVRGR